MKRLIFAIIMVFNLATVSCASAKDNNPATNNEPAILAVFNETNYRNPNVDATLITNDTSTFKKLEIRGDSKLIQEVKRLFEKDMRRQGASIVEKWDNGNHKYIVSLTADRMVWTAYDDLTDVCVYVRHDIPEEITSAFPEIEED